MKNPKRPLLHSLLALLLCISMLVSSTFAWFTDKVSTKNNIITSGNLDLEMYWTDDLSSGTWYNVEEDAYNTIFSYENWEPGYTEVKYIKLVNAGELALNYDLAIEAQNGVGKLAEVISVYYGGGAIPMTGRADLDQLGCIGFLNNVMNGGATASGTLLPADEQSPFHPSGEVVMTVAMSMITTAGNEYQNESSGDFTVRALATQAPYESDSFGSDYDASAELPTVLRPGSVSAPVTAEDGKVPTGGVSMEGNGLSAFVPEGTALADGTDTLTLTVTPMEDTTSGIVAVNDEILIPVDVHIDGVAADNTVPIVIDLGAVLPKYLNIGNYQLIHVENGTNSTMTRVSAKADLTAHNQFTYDPATGEVSVAMATFSEIALLSESLPKWEGKTDYSWYTDEAKTAKSFTIVNGDQLNALAKIVGGMDGQTAYSFKGDTITLASDINLNDAEGANTTKIFYPIGYWYNGYGEEGNTETTPSSSLKNFEGTFDGAGHTIANFYQNTWEVKGDYDGNYYRDGFGLFGRVYGATIKNLTVSNFTSDGEHTTTGCIAAYAEGATFQNIAITNCNPRVYNIGNGGIVGCVGWYAKEADMKTTFTNITADKTNKISALWGSYDVACGGIVGQYYPTSGQSSAGTPKNGGIHFENCHVSAVMDVYNDVCGNYQYYAYRYSGMIIGSIRENVTGEDGRVYPNMTGITASGCTVHYDTWNDYYYCELVANSKASYTHDHQFSRLTEVKAVDGTQITYLDGTTKAVPTSGRYNFVVRLDGEFSTEKAECYHFVDGKVHNHNDYDGDGVEDFETVNGESIYVEDHRHIYLPFAQLFTGYGWGVTSKGLSSFAGIETMDITENNTTIHSVEKFKVILDANTTIETGISYRVGDLFAELDGVTVNDAAVQVAVSGLNNSGITATYVANTTTWEDGTITFERIDGMAMVTIQDYNFCKPTTFVIKDGKLYDVQMFSIVFPNVDKYLYRVGNQNEITLSSLFAETGDVEATDDKVEITVTDNAGTELTNQFTYTANETTWESGKLKFADDYTGPVKVTISQEGSFEKTLNLEVVDAKNITSATSSSGTAVVLLKDVKIASNGTVHYTNCTVYGNGFTFNVEGGMNQYDSKQGHGIIIANNATLDHLRIIGDVYDEYGMYSTTLSGSAQNDYTGAVDATNSTIQNCYIANCATPIRSNGNTIINTTLYGGTVANLLISGGTNTLTDVTTINYNDGRGVIGMGIVITDGASENTKLILNGYLEQHNYVYETDVATITVEEAKTVFNSMFESQFSSYHIGSSPKAVNTGIVSINEALKLKSGVLVDDANTGYLVTDDISLKVSAKGVSKTVKASVASTPSTGTVNNNYAGNNELQGDYLPTFTFDLGDQMLAKDNDDDTRYLIGDKNGLTAMYPKGETALTLDLTKLATVTKYTDVSYPVTAKCVGPDGTEQTGTVTLSDKGTYTLVFTINDNVHYDQNGNKIGKSVTRTYEVKLVLDLYEKAIADATITVSSENLTGDYISSGTNKKYKMYPLKAITSIMDDANKDGTLETFNFKTNIQSAVLTPEGNNAFSNSSTITITYTGGQVLTFVLGTPSGLNSPGASNGGKTFSVYTDSTNGIYLQSDGAVASSSAATGTWPITSWSFKGTSGKVITNNTQVKINFTKPSCVTGDTLVTLADGTQKRIDQVTYSDQLLVWNFFTGKYDVAPSAIIFYHDDDNYRVLSLKFSDGTVVKVINDHGFFDMKENAFVFITEDNVRDYIGHSFAKVNGNGRTAVKLVSYSVTEEYTGCYSIQSAMYNNFMTEGMFSLTIPHYDGWFDYFEIGEGMKYDEKKMQADIAKYGLYTYEDFSKYVTYEQFIAFNGPYLKVLVGRGVVTYEQIIELIAMYVN